MRRLAQLTLALTALTLSACAQHALPPRATTSTVSSPAGPTSAAQEPRVANVLRGLRPFVEIAGRPPVRWTLEERMTHHHVPGVSVAVIEGGRAPVPVRWSSEDPERCHRVRRGGRHPGAPGSASTGATRRLGEGPGVVRGGVSWERRASVRPLG